MGCYTLTLLYCRVAWAWEEHRVQAQFRTREDGRNLIFPPTVAFMPSVVCFIVVVVVWEKVSNGFLFFFSWSPRSANLCVGPISASNPFPGFRKAGLAISGAKGSLVREFTQRLTGFFGRVTKLGSIQTRNTPLQLGPHPRNSSPRFYCLKTGCLRCKLLLQSLGGCLMARVE